MKIAKLLLDPRVSGALLAAPVLFGTAAFAEEEAAAPASPWTVTANMNLTTDYYSRGVSQSWHQPAVQGGFDVSHSSGLYAGVWGSTISERTYVGAGTELDFYGGYLGTVPGVEGLGYSIGLVGYIYPGGGWDEYQLLTNLTGNPVDNNFNTAEFNAGLSYKWVNARVSYTLTNWFGADRSTGWSEDTDGTLYYEMNATVPLPVWGLNLIGHVGRLDVPGELSSDPFFAPANTNAEGIIVESKADMVDWKVGLNKPFEIAGAAGFTATLVYVGGTNGGNDGYWGSRGYGGSSFTTTPGSKDLTEDRVVFTLGRSF